jgi:hypothetical protein
MNVPKNELQNGRKESGVFVFTIIA